MNLQLKGFISDIIWSLKWTFLYKVRQLFKGGNYSREESINFLVFCLHEETWIMVAVDQTTRFYYHWVTHNYNHEWILLFKQRFLQKKCHSLFWHYIYRVSTEIILFRERGWQRQSHNFHPGCIFLLFTLYQNLTTLLVQCDFTFRVRKLFKGGN